MPISDVELLLESLTFQALNGLNVARRVILTGTPIQVCKQHIASGPNLKFYDRMIYQNTSLYLTSPIRTSWGLKMILGKITRMLLFEGEIPWQATLLKPN